MLLLVIAGLLAVGEAELNATLVITGEGGECDEGCYLRAAPHSVPSELPLAISLKFVAPPASLSFVAVGRPSSLHGPCLPLPYKNFGTSVSRECREQPAQIEQSTFELFSSLGTC